MSSGSVNAQMNIHRKPDPAHHWGNGSRDVAESWFYRAHAIGGIGLAVVCVVVLVAGARELPLRALSVVIAALFAWFTYILIFKKAEALFTIRSRPVMYVAVAIPIYVALGWFDSWYQVLLFLAYWQIFSILPFRWSLLAALTLTIANVWGQQGFPRAFPIDSGQEWSLLASVLFVSGLMSAFINAIVRQSNERKSLLEELATTREHLAASERAAGVAEERRRLAGEVHDTIAQDFTSIVMHLEAAEARLAPESPAVTHIAQARQSAREGLGESRRIIHALRPNLLEGATLNDAIAALTNRWSRETGVAATCVITGDTLQLDRATEVALIRVLQESLVNIRKHAEATDVTVTLSYLGDEAILDIRDNGTGFDVTRAPASGGIGLATMRERIANAGGSLSVESAPGEGTTNSVAMRVEASSP